MSINERFETIIKVLFNNNKRAFAKTVGVSPTVVENIVGTRKGNPSYEVLRKVCANANISAEWILFGTENQPVGDFINIRKDLTIVAPKEGEPEDGEHTVTTVFTKGRKHKTQTHFLKNYLTLSKNKQRKSDNSRSKSTN